MRPWGGVGLTGRVRDNPPRLRVAPLLDVITGCPKALRTNAISLDRRANRHGCRCSHRQSGTSVDVPRNDVASAFRRLVRLVGGRARRAPKPGNDADGSTTQADELL
jgi:hypothetical protein